MGVVVIQVRVHRLMLLDDRVNVTIWAQSHHQQSAISRKATRSLLPPVPYVTIVQLRRPAYHIEVQPQQRLNRQCCSAPVTSTLFLLARLIGTLEEPLKGAKGADHQGSGEEAR
jgi:hypothetical protein